MATKTPITRRIFDSMVQNRNFMFEDLLVQGDIEVREQEAYSFVNCELRNIRIVSSIRVISFKGCTFSNLIIEFPEGSSVSRVVGSLEIKDSACSSVVVPKTPRINRITFQNSTIGHIALHVQTQNLTLDRLETNQIIIGGFSVGDFELNNISACKMEFTDGSFSSLKSTNIIESLLDFKNAHCQGEITLSSFHDSTLKFEGATSHRIIMIGHQRVNIDFDRASVEHLALRFGSFRRIRVINDTAITLHTSLFEREYQLDGEQSVLLKQRQIHVNEFQFQGCTLKEGTSFNFNSVKFNTVSMSGLKGKGNLNFHNCEIESDLVMLNSILNTTKFNNVVLGEHCKFVLMDSEITDTTFTNFKWNNNYQLSEDQNVTSNAARLSGLNSLRETYRQLKANHLKHNNKIIALEFQGHELRIHAEIVRQELYESWSRGNWRQFFRNLGNWFILATHKAASDFGLNVWKPLLFLFLFHFLFFNILLLCTPELNLTHFENVSWDATKDAIGKYFYTLLPIHTFNLPEYSANNDSGHRMIFIAGFWDFLMRLSSGYFIFYFLTAARKYHQ